MKLNHTCMNTFTTRFAGFPHEAGELSAYIFSVDTFIISLKNEEVIRYTSTEPENFRNWLEHHGIRNIESEIGSMVFHYYFPNSRSSTS